MSAEFLQDDDDCHDCDPFACSHPSHDNEEPPNDDWIHEAYLRQHPIVDRGR